jgi:hypothetical protein
MKTLFLARVGLFEGELFVMNTAVGRCADSELPRLEQQAVLEKIYNDGVK